MRLSRVNFHHRSRSLHLRTHALEAYGLRMFLSQVGNECDILMGERSLRSRSPQLPSQAPSLRGPPRRTAIRRILKICLPYRRPASPFTQPQLASIDRITVVDVFVSLVAEFRDLVLGARLWTSVVVRATAFCLESFFPPFTRTQRRLG